MAGRLAPSLPKNVARYRIVDARPVAKVKMGPLSEQVLAVTLVDAIDGKRVLGAAAARLPECTVKVSVRAATGRMLLPWTCLRPATSGGVTASLRWFVPNGYQGQASVVFIAKEDGRPGFRIARSVDVV